MQYDARYSIKTNPPTTHEQATIIAFVISNKQERFSAFLSTPKNRRKFTGELAHFGHFDKRFATKVQWNVQPRLKLLERYAQGIDIIYRLLRSKGAGETCWVISEDRDIDGRELDLRVALEKIMGSGTGTILSCIPGKLALFEGEDGTVLLERS